MPDSVTVAGEGAEDPYTAQELINPDTHERRWGAPEFSPGFVPLDEANRKPKASAKASTPKES